MTQRRVTEEWTWQKECGAGSCSTLQQQHCLPGRRGSEEVNAWISTLCTRRVPHTRTHKHTHTHRHTHTRTHTHTHTHTHSRTHAHTCTHASTHEQRLPEEGGAGRLMRMKKWWEGGRQGGRKVGREKRNRQALSALEPISECVSKHELSRGT